MNSINKYLRNILGLVYVISLSIFMQCICTSVIYAEELKENNLPNVFILVWSGVNFADSIGDDAGHYIPHMKGDLLPEGTLYRNMFDYNYGFHTPSIVAIATGNRCDSFIFGVDQALPEYPTIFQYAREKYKGPAYKYWEIGSWTLTAFCNNNEDTLSIFIHCNG